MMEYVTVYTTRNENKLTIIRHLFEQYRLTFRILKESKNTAVPGGSKVQVKKEQLERAKNLLKHNGFLNTPTPGPDSHLLAKFWLYLTMALFLVIIISILIKLSGIL